MSQGSESQVSTSRPGTLNVGRILVVVLPLALLVAGGVLGWGYFDIPSKWHAMRLPALTPGSGVVILQGQPLSGGHLETRHEDPGMPGAVGILDDQGRFELQTEVAGNYVPGAYPGKHRVIVLKRDPTSRGGFGPSPQMTPETYVTFEATPLVIVVERDAAKNSFELVLEGAPRYQDPSALNQAPPVAREIDPQQVAAFVAEQLRQYDTNGDGQLAEDELEKIQGFFRQALLAQDQDGDGAISQEEIAAAAANFLRMMPGGSGGGAGGGDGGGRRGKPARPASEEDESESPAPKPSASPGDATIPPTLESP